jgi:hypothetical protein
MMKRLENPEDCERRIMEVVATGCPRSGTAFLASVFGWTHERWYGYDIRSYNFRTGPAYTPEVSWLAAPYLKKEDALVLHLVREPEAVVRSIASIRMLNESDDWGKFVYSHVETWDPWLFWLRWNEICVSLTNTKIKLEEISHLGPVLNSGTSRSVALIEVPEKPVEHYKEIDQMIKRLGYGA